jgi:hypothetical protein
MAAPSAFLQHRGVSLYHITKDDRNLEFWYSLLPGSDESDSIAPGPEQMDFDVRELAAKLQMTLESSSHADILRSAIEGGLIKPRRVFQL